MHYSGNDDDPNPIPFRYPQQETTQTRYQNYAIQAMLFLLRYSENGFGDENPGPIAVMFTEKQLEVAENVLNLWEIESTDTEQWNVSLHTLFTSLFLDSHPKVDRNAQKDPIALFLMLLNINRHDGQFPECRVVGGCLAGLTHMIRLIATKEISLRREDDDRPDATIL